MKSDSQEVRGSLPGPSRRQVLQLGGLGALSLGLPSSLAAGPTRPAPRRKIQACMLLFYYGGPSHLDTWDVKPNAPAEVRGEFRPISTSVPGLRVGEHLPKVARVMNRLAVLRAMHHPMRNHNSAAVEALCGRTPLKGDLELLADDPNSFPCLGSTLSYLLPAESPLPAHVALPHVMYNVVVLPGQNAGFLGSTYNPFQVTHDPNAPDFRVSELVPPGDVTSERLVRREELRHRVARPTTDGLPRTRTTDALYERAFGLLRSEAVRRAFDLGKENPRLRDRYGRTKHGQSVLLARRLVEAGVRCVSVYDQIHNGPDNWDTHDNGFGRLRDRLLPPADQALAALVEDLADRGLLDSTLVVWTGEFGRTPKINAQGGRDHWPDCFSVVLAGGGVKGGAVHGASDKIGAFPDADGITPGDLAATLFWRFGLDPATELRDLTDRPYRLAEGTPLTGLFT